MFCIYSYIVQQLHYLHYDSRGVVVELKEIVDILQMVYNTGRRFINATGQTLERNIIIAHSMQLSVVENKTIYLHTCSIIDIVL